MACASSGRGLLGREEFMGLSQTRASLISLLGLNAILTHISK
jgi:hypothetical protein